MDMAVQVRDRAACAVTVCREARDTVRLERRIEDMFQRSIKNLFEEKIKNPKAQLSWCCRVSPERDAITVAREDCLLSLSRLSLL